MKKPIPTYGRDDCALLDEWGSYRKTTTTKAIQIDGAFAVNTREGTLECADGWLALDADGYPYPIAASVFEATYEPSD